MKKFISSILSTLMLSSFVSNISLAQEPTTNDVNQIQIGETDSCKKTVIKETAREKAIKLCKQEQEKKDKFFENEIKKLENMSDKKYKWQHIISKLKSLAWIPITLLILFYKHAKITYKSGFYDGRIDGEAKTYSSGALDALINGRNSLYFRYIQQECNNNHKDDIPETKVKEFLKSFVSKLHPDGFNKRKISDNFQQIYNQAKNIENEIKKNENTSDVDYKWHCIKNKLKYFAGVPLALLAIFS